MKKYRNSFLQTSLMFGFVVYLLSCSEKNSLPTIVLKTKLAKGDTIAITVVLDNNITDSVSIDFGSGIRKTFFPRMSSTGLQIQSGNSVVEIKTWDTFRQPVEDSIISIYAPASAIVQFGCGLGKISYIDLSNCMALKKINISNNLLEQLDLRNNFRLESLNCSKNRLSKLNLDQNINLVNLICTDNNLIKLDLTKLQNLEQIQCQNNSIKEIHIPEQNRIGSLDCSNNNLLALNTKRCGNLRNLNCTNNYLTKLEFFRLASIENLKCNNNSISPDSIPNPYNLSDYLPQDCNVSGYLEMKAKQFNMTPQGYVNSARMFIPEIVTGTKYDKKSDLLTIDFRSFHSIQISLKGKNPIDYSKDKLKILDMWYYLAKDGRIQIQNCYINEIRYTAKGPFM